MHHFLAVYNVTGDPHGRKLMAGSRGVCFVTQCSKKKIVWGVGEPEPFVREKEPMLIKA